MQRLHPNSSIRRNGIFTQSTRCQSIYYRTSPKWWIRKRATCISCLFSFLFAYLFTDASSINLTKVIIDIKTKPLDSSTTLITDKGSAFNSTINAEITQVLGVTLNYATTKHPRTNGKLERIHASLKSNLEMASGDNRINWH